jgi:hypothetical protein
MRARYLTRASNSSPPSLTADHCLANTGTLPTGGDFFSGLIVKGTMAAFSSLWLYLATRAGANPSASGAPRPRVALARPIPKPKRQRGRPRKPKLPETIAGGPLRVPKAVGRPRKYDPKAILALVDAHRAAAVAKGKRLRRGSALCELLAEAIKTRDPKKYQELQRLRDTFEESYPERGALRRALERVEGAHLHKLERLLSYAVNGRRARK